jgi:hypothetical protein
MVAITPFAKLVAVLIVAAIDVANYIWGTELVGWRNEQIIGVVVTLILAAIGMIAPTVPGVARTGHPHGTL